jgi:hypothetical protein
MRTYLSSETYDQLRKRNAEKAGDDRDAPGTER